MDTEKLIAHSRARFDHAAAKRLLKEKYQAKMLFAYNGGMFRAGPELLALLQSIPAEDNAVIMDLYENPIKITPVDLQQLAHSRWQEQMNAWLVEYEEMSKQR
jgi:hypothetical protein